MSGIESSAERHGVMPMIYVPYPRGVQKEKNAWMVKHALVGFPIAMHIFY